MLRSVPSSYEHFKQNSENNDYCTNDNVKKMSEIQWLAKWYPSFKAYTVESLILLVLLCDNLVVHGHILHVIILYMPSNKY